VIRRLSPPSLVTQFPSLRCTASAPRPSPLWPAAMAPPPRKTPPPSSQRGKNQSPGSGTPRGGGGGRGRSGRGPSAATTSPSVKETTSPFQASAFGSSPTFNAKGILPPPAAPLSGSEGVAREEDIPAADSMEVEAVAATSADVPATAASAVGDSAKEAAPAFIQTLEEIEDPDLLTSLAARAEEGDKDAIARLAFIKRRLTRQEKHADQYALGKTDDEVKKFSKAAAAAARVRAVAAAGKGVALVRGYRPAKRGRPVSSPSGHTPREKVARPSSASSSASASTSTSSLTSGRSFAEALLRSDGRAASPTGPSTPRPPPETFPYMLHVHNNHVEGFRGTLAEADFHEVQKFLVHRVLQYSRTPSLQMKTDQGVQLRTAYIAWTPENGGHGKIACLDNPTRVWFGSQLQEFMVNELRVAGWEPPRPIPLRTAFLNVTDVGLDRAAEVLSLLKAFNDIRGSVTLKRQDIFQCRPKMHWTVLLNLDEAAVASLSSQANPWEVHLGVARRHIHCPDPSKGPGGATLPSAPSDATDPTPAAVVAASSVSTSPLHSAETVEISQ
jgi:hypothetical protein